MTFVLEVDYVDVESFYCLRKIDEEPLGQTQHCEPLGIL